MPTTSSRVPSRRAATNSHRAREAGVGPVEVVEDHHERAPLGRASSRPTSRPRRAGSGPSRRRAGAGRRMLRSGGRLGHERGQPPRPGPAVLGPAGGSAWATTARSTCIQGQNAAPPRLRCSRPRPPPPPPPSARATSSSARRVLPIPGSPADQHHAAAPGGGLAQGPCRGRPGRTSGPRAAATRSPKDARGDDGRRRPPSPGSPPPLEGGGVGQDVGLEPGQLGPGIDAQLLHQHGPSLGEGPSASPWRPSR